MGGHLCKLIGGPSNGQTIWMPQLLPQIEVANPIAADDAIGRMKRGESVEDVMSDNRCWYALMSFYSAEGHLVYMSFNGELEN